MKIKFLALLSGIAICVLCAGGANAEVINFDDLETPGLFQTFMSSYSTNSGFTVSAGGNMFASPPTGNSLFFGSANLIFYSSQWMTLTASGMAFTINSMDVRGVESLGAQFFCEAYSDSTYIPKSSFSSVLPDDYDWHTVYFDSSFEDITSFKWKVWKSQPFGDTSHAFDNIVLNGGSVAPEPASMVLFGLGGLTLAAIKRRKTKV